MNLGENFFTYIKIYLRQITKNITNPSDSRTRVLFTLMLSNLQCRTVRVCSRRGVNTVCCHKCYMETRYVCRLSDNLLGFYINTTYPITLLGFFLHMTFSYL